VVILRLPEKRSIVKGGSACMKCKAKLKPLDLIPILSFFILKGKCRSCKAVISWQYPIVEFVVGALFVCSAIYYNVAGAGVSLLFIRDIVFIAALVVVFVADLKYYLVFTSVTVPITVFAFLMNVFIFANSVNYYNVILNLVIGMVIGGGFFYLQHLMSKGKWIGGGDIYIGLMMGAMLSSSKTVLALFLSYIIGAVISVVLLSLKKKSKGGIVPFGVFLSIGTLIAMFFGSEIINWYLGLL